jgi:anti-sigma factor (TIGR02949 family)
MISVSRFTCEEAFRRIDDYLDRELSATEMESVRAHLETCAACTREFAYEAGILREVRRKLQRVEVSPELLARIARRLEEAANASQ